MRRKADKNAVEPSEAAVRGQQPIVPADLAVFRILSGPQISPDGRRVVFVEKHVGPRNGYASNLWLVSIPAEKSSRRKTAGQLPADASPPRQLTQGNQDGEPQWSPDGTQLAFIRDDSAGRSNIFLMRADGGEARRLTEFPEGAIRTFLWSPDGKWLAVSFRPCDPRWTDTARKQRTEAGLSDPPEIVERLWYRLDGEGVAAAQRRRLYLVETASGTMREIYGEDVAGEFCFDFSPDSRQLILSTNRAAEPNLEPWKDELLRIDAASGRATPIRGLPPGPKTAVRWSPGGDALAYAGRLGKEPVYSHKNLELFVCDAAGGRCRSLTGKLDLCVQAQGMSDTALDEGPPTLVFSPDGRRIYFRLCHHGESHVASIPVRGGRIKFLTAGPIDVRLGNVSANGRRLAVTVGSATALAEVGVLDSSAVGARPRMLTDLNGPLLARRRLGVPETHWVEAADGHRVQVWAIFPPGKAPTARKKVPAILEIHGGPHAQFGSTFFHEFQVLASAGYAVFYSNPRGSKGYGAKHAEAIFGRWGTVDWTDLQAVIALMKKHPGVDARRLGVIGGSYGGYMTNWLIGHGHDFAAAVTDRSLSNLVSFSGSTDIIEPPESFFPGNFWDQAEARWNQSPLKHVGQVRTPTLVIHSEGDLRCNIEQAEQFYSALKLLGVRARFVRYPRATSHGMSRNGPPDLRIHRLQEILRWWQEHLRGKSRRG